MEGRGVHTPQCMLQWARTHQRCCLIQWKTFHTPPCFLGTAPGRYIGLVVAEERGWAWLQVSSPNQI